MGKARGAKRAKAKKAQVAALVDEHFDTTKPVEPWFAGLSALCLLEEGEAQASSSGAGAMDTADFVPLAKSGERAAGVAKAPGLRVAGTQLKRGSRTTAQKRRRASKQEKAEARAEQAAAKGKRKLGLRVSKNSLKTLY